MKRIIIGEGKLVESLLGRIALIVLFSATFSVSFAMLFLLNKGVSPIVLKFTVVAASAMATGLQARGLLKENTFALRYTTAFTAIILSFGVLKPLTRGFMGLDLLRQFSRADNVDDGLQLLLAATLIWLAQRTWSGGVRVAAPATKQNGRVAKVTAARHIKQPVASRAKPSLRPKVFSSAYWRSTWEKRKRISPIAISQILQAPREWTSGKKIKTAATSNKTRKSLSKKQPRRNADELVHLSKVIEHRCPYCLELVKPADPRGVETCKVCKTKHHADCWDITGVCQVPHKHL